MERNHLIEVRELEAEEGEERNEEQVADAYQG